MTRGELQSEGYPRAVVFDFDGVILESADIKTQAFLELFSQYPEHKSAILEHHLANVGVSRYRKFEWIYANLLGQVIKEEESQRLGQSFTDIAFEQILRCPFVSGAVECLEGLHDRLTFIASGTPEDELRQIVRKRELTAYFHGVWGSPATKVAILERVMTDYGLVPGEVVFIGDGISDYEAARSTGVRFIARTTSNLDATWQRLGATCVQSLSELSEHLGLTVES
jgi:phosphoglycolate phosphatase-like HAD superfamily hydrolase